MSSMELPQWVSGPSVPFAHAVDASRGIIVSARLHGRGPA
jgi:hypothetical protein